MLLRSDVVKSLGGLLSKLSGPRYLKRSASQLYARHGAVGATYEQMYGQAHGFVSAQRGEAEWLGTICAAAEGCGLSKPA